jgi:hypothetical protein
LGPQGAYTDNTYKKKSQKITITTQILTILTARGLEITPGILEYCLNQIFDEIIMEYEKYGKMIRKIARNIF